MDSLERIRASKLCSEDCLQETVKRLSDSGRPLSEESILKDLVVRGLLSRWQAKIIGEYGKFKGFIQGRYVIVCGHRQSDEVTIAEAYDREANQYVLLKVSRNAPTEFLMSLSLDETGGFPIVSRDARLG